MDLMCTSPIKIGLLVSAWYLGYMVGALAFALPDKIGRKRSVILGFGLSLLCETVVICVPHYYIRMAGFFGIGLSQVKNSTSYQWLSESVPTHYKSTACTIISSWDAIP